MDKRGQVFLLGAIIIVLALLTVTGKYNSVKEYPLLSDYKEHTENYMTEFPKVVNDAKYKNADVSAKINDFNTMFVKEVKTKDPNFGVAYMYKDNSGNIKVVNTLTNKVLTVKLTGASEQDVDNVKVWGVDTRNLDNNVCISGIGCSTTRTDARDFGGRFSNDIDLVNKLQGKRER